MAPRTSTPTRAPCFAPRAWPGILALCAAPLAAAQAPEPLALSEVAHGVWVHSGKPLALDAPGHDDIANLGFVIGERCVAVIDTGGSVRIGRALRAAVGAHTRLPVCYVINTHVHVDHVLGNAAFRADRPQFVGHEALGEALARSRAFFVKNYAADLDPPADAAQIVGPDRSVGVGGTIELDLGGRRLQLRAWPKAHTDCDLTVFDESTATLFTGDLLFVGRTPALEGSLKGWLAVSDTLARLPARHVVPGHGASGTHLAAALSAQRGYLAALLAAVRAALAAGEPLQEAVREVHPQQDQWLLSEQTTPRNVSRAYQELEWE